MCPKIQLSEKWTKNCEFEFSCQKLMISIRTWIFPPKQHNFRTKNWLLEHCVIDSSSQLRVKTTIVCRFQLKVKLSESFLYFSWPFLMIEKGLPQDLLIKNPDFYCRLWCLESQEKFDLISAVPRIHALWTSFSSLFS